MPTPFTHLALAYELRSALSGRARAVVEPQWAAFLLGQIAPDVQTISGQRREETHFFDLPFAPTHRAAAALLAAHPALAYRHTQPAQAAFLAGYLAHLALDQLWISAIFQPVFLEGPWVSPRERSYIHNVLRAWVDAADRARLSDEVSEQLWQAEPQHWLPFVQDGHLRAWRDFVADQLRPGAASRTVEVFAERAGLEPQTFAALLHDPTALEARVFSRASRQRLNDYWQTGLRVCGEVIEAYVGGECSNTTLAAGR